MKQWFPRLTAAAAFGATLTAAGFANADCPATLDGFGPNPVFVTGSSASQGILQAMAGVLSVRATPITIVYLKSESCDGVAKFTGGTQLKLTATWWPPAGDGGAGGTQSCTPGTTQQYLADASVADVYGATCQTLGVTAWDTTKFAEINGPIQAMTFIVHPASSETSISYEAARVIYKHAGTPAVTPWTLAGSLVTRPGGATGSGTRAMVGAALGFSDGDWSTSLTVAPGSGDMLAAISGTAAAAHSSQTLGILTVNATDKNRPGTASTSQVKVLAYKHKDQQCGYLPDSGPNAEDKINVREGRYAIWGPLHFITAIDSNGKPISSSNAGHAAADAAVQAFATAIQMPAGTALSDSDKKTIIDASAAAFVVPQCAMRVRRDAEVGPEASWQAPEPCGCYWEAVATKVSTTTTYKDASGNTCNACTGDSDCASHSGTPKCRYGFCEVQ